MAEMKNNSGIRDRLKSFNYAFSGIAQLIKSEANFRIHILVLMMVTLAGILLGISAAEWIFIILAAAVVLVAESFNTAVERMCDIISPAEDHRIKIIKDILAAAVLISVIMAVITGIIIFLPDVLALILQ